MHDIETRSRRTFTKRGKHELKGVPAQPPRLYAQVRDHTTIKG